MLIRRACFEDCGGIQITWGWDSTLKAKIRGWKVKRFEYVKALETRFVGSVEGYWVVMCICQDQREGIISTSRCSRRKALR